MANAIRKTPDLNGVYQYVYNVNASDYPAADWELDPDLESVSGVSQDYWKYNGTNVVVEMSQAEKDAVDAALEVVKRITADPVCQIYSEDVTFGAGESKVIDLVKPMYACTLNVYDPNYQLLIGESLISPKGTGWDPGNKSTGEANINNGVKTDLCYNNSAVGNTPGVIFGIDMGGPTTINAMRRYDYNASYYDTEWQFIGTNDATAATYDVIFTATQSAYSGPDDPFFRAFADQTYRYFGVRCVSSFNASYTIISELELLTGTLATVGKATQCGKDYDAFKISESQIEVTNLRAEAASYRLVIVGN